MIDKYADDLARQMGVKLSKVSVEAIADCFDASLLNFASGRKQASVLVYKADLVELKKRKRCDRLDLKIRAVLAEF
jgi:hypothetical protein